MFSSGCVCKLVLWLARKCHKWNFPKNFIMKIFRWCLLSWLWCVHLHECHLDDVIHANLDVTTGILPIASWDWRLGCWTGYVCCGMCSPHQTKTTFKKGSSALISQHLPWQSTEWTKNRRQWVERQKKIHEDPPLISADENPKKAKYQRDKCTALAASYAWTPANFQTNSMKQIAVLNPLKLLINFDLHFNGKSESKWIVFAYNQNGSEWNKKKVGRKEK